MISNNARVGLTNLASRLVSDESGAEVVEAVLVVGLIAVLCLLCMRGAGEVIANRWNDLVGIFDGGDATS